jgi:predicted small lipoprotein YifL
VRWVILWLLTTLVATCGQKGPLYLPEETPEAEPDSVFSASSTNARRLEP